MADHRPPPQPRGIEAGVMRFAADRGRIEQHLRAHQHHRPCGFGIPLVPADADAQRRRAVPHLEPGIAGAEIEFFLIAGAVGNVALAVHALDAAVGVDHRQRIIMMRAVGFEEAGRDMDLQFAGKCLHRLYRRMFGGRLGIGEQALVLDPAEILAFEQFGRQDHLRPARGGFANEARDMGDVAVDIGGEAQLEGCNGNLGHGRS
jgi:hypothetical protein